jgi:hypothetical protein
VTRAVRARPSMDHWEPRCTSRRQGLSHRSEDNKMHLTNSTGPRLPRWLGWWSSPACPHVGHPHHEKDDAGKLAAA